MNRKPSKSPNLGLLVLDSCMKTIQESKIWTLGLGSAIIIETSSVVWKPSKSPKFGPWVIAPLKPSKPAVLNENHPRVRNYDAGLWLRWNHPNLQCCTKTIQESEIRTLGLGCAKFKIIQTGSIVWKPSKSPKCRPLVLAPPKSSQTH